LFTILANILDKLNSTDLNVVGLDGVKLCTVTKDLAARYIESEEICILAPVLTCIYRLVARWPLDAALIFTDSLVLKLLHLTSISHRLDEVGNAGILKSLIQIWLQYFLTYVRSDVAQRKATISRLVEVMAVQLDNCPYAETEILFWFSEVSKHSEMTSDIYRMLLNRFERANYRSKESLLLIFFEMSVRYPREMAEMGCEDLLLCGLDGVSASLCERYVLALLKAIYALFAADNDLAERIGDDEFIEFLKRKESEENNETGVIAGRILDLFFGEQQDVSELMGWIDIA
jgi:hypothetical protein